MVGGYMERIGVIDLSVKKIEEIRFSDKDKRDFLGGYGLGVKYILENTEQGIDPLGPDNILGVLAGPLTGIGIPTTSRYTVCGKSPLTETWGDSNGSGDFGPYLKFSGYDGLFIKGASDRPVYLIIDNGKIEIKDAKDIWGKDSYETEDHLKDKYGKRSPVLCIGQAGETKSLISAIIVDRGRAAARSGLGAVMGSKNLKAIVVRGGMKVPVSQEEKTKQIIKRFSRQIKNSFGASARLKIKGTVPSFENYWAIGEVPLNNWFGDPEDLDYKTLNYENQKKYITRNKSCWRCPMSCWGEMMVENGRFALNEPAHWPEYETIGMFGGQCNVDDFEMIIKCNDICNRYGIDTMSAAGTIAFAIKCFEKGIIDKKDTDGLELKWGDPESVYTLMDMMAHRKGIGDILCHGSKYAAEIFGNDSIKYAVQVQGSELAAHDSRNNPAWAQAYAFDATPGRHTQGITGSPAGLQDVYPDIDFSSSLGRDLGRAKAHKILSALYQCMNTLGFCIFGFWSTEITTMAESYSAVTGWKVDIPELVKTGERIMVIRHLFNLREGNSLMDWEYPDIARGKPPLSGGPLKDISFDLEGMKEEFLMEMDWDTKTGIPSENKLKELGLDGIKIK